MSAAVSSRAVPQWYSPIAVCYALFDYITRGLEAAARVFADALGALVALGMSGKQSLCVSVYEA